MWVLCRFAEERSFLDWILSLATGKIVFETMKLESLQYPFFKIFLNCSISICQLAGELQNRFLRLQTVPCFQYRPKTDFVGVALVQRC